jgi:3-oxoacyl-[acyl-carrier-protein] synthase I
VRAIVGTSHILCSIGSGTKQVWAAARAGISRIGNSHVMDRHQEPIKMGLVPESALGQLPLEFDSHPLPPRARRLLRLAAPSLRAAAKDAGPHVVLFLGLPRLHADVAPWMKHVPEYLEQLTGVHLDHRRSVVVPEGRAAALLALERALELLQSDPGAEVVVGGVDSYLDMRLLEGLDREGRLLGPRVMDGFIPGEGAAFFRLSSASRHSPTDSADVLVHGAAYVMDPTHRYGTEPARGEGLALALDRVRQHTTGLAPIATAFAGLNGESFDAKLWGVARLRHNDCFAPNMLVEHPADKFGDAGAAMGAMLVALAARSLARGTRPGPMLVWTASDHEPCACALLALAERGQTPVLSRTSHEED